MPTPKREEGEEAQKFMGRCMTSEVMSKEYPDQKQRVAVCTSQSRAGAAKGSLSQMVQDELVYAEYDRDCECGEVEELTESNFLVPEESDYEDFGEEVEEVSADGLWDNIRKKKEREGKNYKPAKKGDKDRPDPKSFKKAQSGAGEYAFDSKEKAQQKAKQIGLDGVHQHKTEDGKTVWMPGRNMKDFRIGISPRRGEHAQLSIKEEP